MEKKYEISFDKISRSIMIENNSDLDLVISSIPLKPKRTSYDLFIVKRNSSLILDEVEFEMYNYYFRFIK